MTIPNKDEQVLQHIVRYCNQVELTILKLKIDKSAFEKNFLFQNAISMPILQVGELVKKLSDDFRRENSAVPWRAISGMRDHLAHNYIEMDINVAWETVCDDIPLLKKYCEQILTKRGVPIPEPEELDMTP